MRTYLDCYPCFLRQALDAARLAGASDDQQETILTQVLALLQQIPPSSTPPETGNKVHCLVRQEVGNGDPYQAVKEASTHQALALYPRLRELVQEADDGLDVALRLSIAGNIIDLGPDHEYDLWDVVERVLAQPFARDDRAAFWEALASADWMLYLADNAGETVFDRVLIEELDVPVIYAVKGGPVLNDATVEDARDCGLTELVSVIDNGDNAPGTILKSCSKEFVRRFEGADLIISKGQGNFETLSDVDRNIYFILRAKCPVIAEHLDCPVGAMILRKNRVMKAGQLAGERS